MINNSPPIFLINLDSSTDRLRESYSRLDPIGIEFERFKAVYGAKISLDERNKFYSEELNLKQYHKPLSPGEIGCYMSHLKVLQHIVENNIKYAIILEDDFKIVGDLSSAIKSLEDITFEWDMIKLAEYGNRERPTAYEFKLNEHFHLRVQKKVSAGTCAQAISLNGAKKILKTSIPFGRPVDTDYQHWWEKNIEVLTLSPCPLKQDLDFDSTIAVMSKGQKFNSAFWRRKLQQIIQKINNQKHTRKLMRKYKKLN